MTITQTEEDEFISVGVEDNDDHAIDCSTNQGERSYTFIVEQGSKFNPNRNAFVSGGDSKDLTVVFNNKKMPIVAPTQFSSRHTPFVLLLIFGAVLLILGSGWKIKARKAGTADDREEEATYRAELTTEAENHVRWRNSLWVNYKGDPPCPRADTGGPPEPISKMNASPSCPRAALWTKGPPGRGDPMG